MANTACSCGTITYRVLGITWCRHCDEPPRQSIVNCNACRVYHHTTDMRVLLEYQAESARHNQ